MKIVYFFVTLYTILVPNKKNFNESYFHPDKVYHYQALYIDSASDTITNESLYFAPTGEPWAFQKGLQEAYYIHYQTDTLGYKNLKKYNTDYKEKDSPYYLKHEKLKINPKERTGGYNTDSHFFMHPPRSNQYDILFYSCYPRVAKANLQDTVTTQVEALTTYDGSGVFEQIYIIQPIESYMEIEGSDEKVKVWKLDVTSIAQQQTDYSSKLGLNSKMTALYCEEYGFIRMHHSFQNGIKIHLDLVTVAIDSEYEEVEKKDSFIERIQSRKKA